MSFWAIEYQFSYWRPENVSAQFSNASGTWNERRRRISPWRRRRRPGRRVDGVGAFADVGCQLFSLGNLWPGGLASHAASQKSGTRRRRRRDFESPASTASTRRRGSFSGRFFLFCGMFLFDAAVALCCGIRKSRGPQLCCTCSQAFADRQADLLSLMKDMTQLIAVLRSTTEKPSCRVISISCRNIKSWRKC